MCNVTVIETWGKYVASTGRKMVKKNQAILGVYVIKKIILVLNLEVNLFFLN